MYTGELMDANDLVYLRARYYHSGLGVFTSLDPVENLNRYQYVGGNVANWTDPLGLCPPDVDPEVCVALLEGAKLAPWIVAGATAAPLIVIGGVGIVGLGLIGGILYISPWEPTYPENFPPTRVATPTYTSPFPQTNATPAPPNYQPITQQQAGPTLELRPTAPPYSFEPNPTATTVPQTLTDPCPERENPEAPPETQERPRPHPMLYRGAGSDRYAENSVWSNTIWGTSGCPFGNGWTLSDAAIDIAFPASYSEQPLSASTVEAAISESQAVLRFLLENHFDGDITRLAETHTIGSTVFMNRYKKRRPLISFTSNEMMARYFATFNGPGGRVYEVSLQEALAAGVIFQPQSVGEEDEYLVPHGICTRLKEDFS